MILELKTFQDIASWPTPSDIDCIITHGYYSFGDGGGARYKRVSAPPSHTGYGVSATGSYFELQIDGTVLSIKSMGAKGDGIADDTIAICNALYVYKRVFIPSGNYKITGHISIIGSRTVFGDGYNSLIFRGIDDTATETIIDSDGTVYPGRNTLIFIESGGAGTKISDIRLSGNDNADAGTTLIEFGHNARNISIERVRGSYGKTAILTNGELWLTKFAHVWFAACESGVDFSNSGFKTTCVFQNCYMENCGTGYVFTNMQYSTMNACGADHIARPIINPYDPTDVSGYAKAYGNPSRSSAVYDFKNCKGIVMNGCGCEHSWGNGMVRNVASDITLNGPRAYKLQSSYSPNYISFPSFGVGPFSTGTEACSFSISNASIDNYKQWVADAQKIYFCGFNYLAATYGNKNFFMAELRSSNIGTWVNGVFGGQGNTIQYCKDYNANGA